MKITDRFGNGELATVFIAENREGQQIEFVESIQPPFPAEKKWVNIISTLYGCPVNCKICDAGSNYQGKLSVEELLFQIDYLINYKFPDLQIPAEKWKIQFARMGEPAYNLNVIEVLKLLPVKYKHDGLMPCISTIAPKGTDKFFSELLRIGPSLYKGRFQLQFSIHTTNENLRDELIPALKWDFQEIAAYGERFFRPGSRKIGLNFAVTQDVPIDPKIVRQYFNPAVFIIKLTPMNPTYSARRNHLKSGFDSEIEIRELDNFFKEVGFNTIISIGEMEENAIGSNCGQFISSLFRSEEPIKNSYTHRPVSLG